MIIRKMRDKGKGHLTYLQLMFLKEGTGKKKQNKKTTQSKNSQRYNRRKQSWIKDLKLQIKKTYPFLRTPNKVLVQWNSKDLKKKSSVVTGT